MSYDHIARLLRQPKPDSRRDGPPKPRKRRSKKPEAPVPKKPGESLKVVTGYCCFTDKTGRVQSISVTRRTAEDVLLAIDAMAARLGK